MSDRWEQQTTNVKNHKWKSQTLILNQKTLKCAINWKWKKGKADYERKIAYFWERLNKEMKFLKKGEESERELAEKLDIFF